MLSEILYGPASYRFLFYCGLIIVILSIIIKLYHRSHNVSGIRLFLSRTWVLVVAAILTFTGFMQLYQYNKPSGGYFKRSSAPTLSAVETTHISVPTDSPELTNDQVSLPVDSPVLTDDRESFPAVSDDEITPDRSDNSPSPTPSVNTASPDALLVAQSKLKLDRGELALSVMTDLVVNGKTSAEAKAIVDAAIELSRTIDGMVDNELINLAQAQDEVFLSEMAEIIIQSGYSVSDFKAMSLAGPMELSEYGMAFGAKDNFQGTLTADEVNICVLVWGEEVTINGSRLGYSVTLIYPGIAATIEIIGGGYRPFAVNPDIGIANWQARLLADAALKLVGTSNGTLEKYIFNKNGLQRFESIATEMESVTWLERADKRGEYLLPDENAGRETLARIKGTMHLAIDVAAICDQNGQVIYEIRYSNSVLGNVRGGVTDRNGQGEGVQAQVDNGAPSGWTIEYSRDEPEPILGVQGDGYLLIRDGKATYWPGYYGPVFVYSQ